MNTMDFQELFSLLQNGDENDRIEAKKALAGIGKSFLETVAAFSNEPDLGGGYILLGISRNEETHHPKYIITGGFFSIPIYCHDLSSFVAKWSTNGPYMLALDNPYHAWKPILGNVDLLSKTLL